MRKPYHALMQLHGWTKNPSYYNSAPVGDRTHAITYSPMFQCSDMFIAFRLTNAKRLWPAEIKSEKTKRQFCYRPIYVNCQESQVMVRGLEYDSR